MRLILTTRVAGLDLRKEKEMITLDVNGKKHPVAAPSDTPLLWVLRESLQLTGTKFGCGEGLCGACTVLIDGEPTLACITSVGEAAGSQILTIEGLAENHPLKRAWMEVEVPQCGYCQSGQILAAAALLRDNPSPTDEDIDEAMSDNLCRCGTYPRIRKAIHRVAAGGAANERAANGAKGGAQ
jgi:aerobic-type carbon monoxide dehydrogenase small subunit (CoxS/CutS family)